MTAGEKVAQQRLSVVHTRLNAPSVFAVRSPQLHISFR